MARLRKEHSITQTQLAERLGVSQQTIQAYESGRWRIQVAALPELARLLSTTLEELFGQQQETTVRKRGPAPKWQQQLKAIDQLPKSPRASRNLLRRCSMPRSLRPRLKRTVKEGGFCSKQIKQHRHEAGA
ncbi:helix-turn-helix transcriptional regulator [Pseudomonas sp. MWU13-3659]|uniref:helix-turn-helix transcriptional regulator n=1 Tax=Pseudomonas sp. MWU13-3659 TaxID=2986964 RepID=UPI003369DB6A